MAFRTTKIDKKRNFVNPAIVSIIKPERTRESRLANAERNRHIKMAHRKTARRNYQ